VEGAAPNLPVTVEDLSRRERELTALLEATQALASTLELPSILQRIVRGAADISGADAVRLFLLDETGQVLRWRMGVGVPPEAEQGIAIPVGESFSGKVAATGEPLAVSDTRDDPRLLFHTHVTTYGLISYLGLPVKSADRIFGVLVFNTISPRVYSSSEIGLLAFFARQAALAIQNARLYGELQRELSRRKEAEQHLQKLAQAVEGATSPEARPGGGSICQHRGDHGHLGRHRVCQP